MNPFAPVIKTVVISTLARARSAIRMALAIMPNDMFLAGRAEKQAGVGDVDACACRPACRSGRTGSAPGDSAIGSVPA